MCVALPPTSVSLVNTAGQGSELRCTFNPAHQQPVELLIVPVTSHDGQWYHMAPDDSPHAHDRILAEHLPTAARLLNLTQRTDIALAKNSFKLQGQGLQSITQYMRQRSGLPHQARWLVVLLHPQIETDLEMTPQANGLDDAPTQAICSGHAHAYLSDMLKRQVHPAMAGRIANGLLKFP